ncbi:hypothetical protein WAI453_006433 [Rhynchosporium graminicola]
MTGLLGPPPPEFLTRGKSTSKYRDLYGNWKEPVPLPNQRNLQSLVTNPRGDDKDDILDLFFGFLCWLPEEQVAAGQAYYHSWLRGRYDEPIAIPTTESWHLSGRECQCYHGPLANSSRPLASRLCGGVGLGLGCHMLR